MQELKAKGDPAAVWETFTFIHDPALHVKHIQRVPTRKEIPFLCLWHNFLGSWSWSRSLAQLPRWVVEEQRALHS